MKIMDGLVFPSHIINFVKSNHNFTAVDYCLFASCKTQQDLKLMQRQNEMLLAENTSLKLKLDQLKTLLLPTRKLLEKTVRNDQHCNLPENVDTISSVVLLTPQKFDPMAASTARMASQSQEIDHLLNSNDCNTDCDNLILQKTNEEQEMHLDSCGISSDIIDSPIVVVASRVERNYSAKKKMQKLSPAVTSTWTAISKASSNTMSQLPLARGAERDLRQFPVARRPLLPVTSSNHPTCTSPSLLITSTSTGLVPKVCNEIDSGLKEGVVIASIPSPQSALLPKRVPGRQWNVLNKQAGDKTPCTPGKDCVSSRNLISKNSDTSSSAAFSPAAPPITKSQSTPSSSARYRGRTVDNLGDSHDLSGDDEVSLISNCGNQKILVQSTLDVDGFCQRISPGWKSSRKRPTSARDTASSLLEAYARAHVKCSDSNNLGKTFKKSKITSKTVQSKASSKLYSNPFETSYDRPMIRANGEGSSAHINCKYREVIRKKSERRQLMASECDQCDQYYTAQNMPEHEHRVRLARCSRHRAVAKVPASSDDYWDLDFPSTPDCIDKGYANKTIYVENIREVDNTRSLDLEVVHTDP